MLQLHGTGMVNGVTNMHLPAAPDSSGNRYNLVIQVNELEAEGHTDESTDGFTGDGFANTRNAVRVGTDTTYDEGRLVSRTPPRVVTPDSSGMIPIDVTYADPDRARNNTRRGGDR